MTIRAVAAPCRGDDPDAFAIETLTLPAWLFRDTAGEELAIRCGRVTIRLSIEAGTLLHGAVRLEYRIGGRERLTRRVLALAQYDAMLRLGRIPPSLQGKARAVDRPALLLRTLDAMATGQGARGIAIALFGTGEVDTHWDHPSDYLRMKTRRLVAKARYLVNQGYLDLLA